MKYNIKNLFATIASVVLVFSMSFSICHAETIKTSRTDFFRVGKNQTWTSLKPLTRTQKFNNARVRVISVTPTEDKKDNYTWAQVMVVDAKDGRPITQIKKVEEGTGFQKLSIINGKLKTSKVIFKYRGNNYKYSAYIHATSDAR